MPKEITNPTETPVETPETPTEPVETPQEVKTNMTPDQFRELVAAESENLRLKQQMKADQEALAELKAKQDAWAQNPIEAYKEHGGNVQMLAEMMSDGKPSTETELQELRRQQQELAAWKEEQERVRKEAAETEERNAYLSGFENTVRTEYLEKEDYKQAKDWFDLYKAMTGTEYNLQQAIYQQQNDIYQKTGKALTPAEVAGMLKDEAQKRFEEIQALSFWGGGPAQPAQEPQKKKEPAAEGGKSLTSQLEQDSPSPSNLSREARLRKAVAAAEAIEADRK